MFFVGYTGLVDGATKYVLTPDAIIVVLYSWIGIILRNAYYSQEAHDWSTNGHPLNLFRSQDQGVPISSGVIDGDEVSPISLLAFFNSRHFSMIVLILLNKLNRHEKGLVTDIKNDQSLWKNLNKLQQVFYDILRCLLKDLALRLILKGTDIAFAVFKRDLPFVIIASLLINHLVKAPKWYKR